ncbi:hypothetical protein V6N12_032702 [Hibiscus sabdariffa]|uniref:Retrotransposon gag domain-containing protein n=1 Tax=Hibiscus sabdariffa TaxID=183260 RepID=A0ABR2BP64_9ROSI
MQLQTKDLESAKEEGGVPAEDTCLGTQRKHKRNNGQHPVDEQDPPAPAEDLEGLNPAVTIPEFEAEHFELKPVMFNMLNTLGQFGGSPAENACQHLKSFLEICNSFKIHGVSNDVLKLKLFPYSLRDKAKAWMNNLPSGSLQSWTELCRSFLARFIYNSMTDNLRNRITSFRQEDDEAMHEAWERYRDLFRRCLDDKGDVSNRDNGSCLGRYLGGDSDLGRASCCVIGLSLSPIN